MSSLQEATLDQLWAKYVRRFGGPPPIRTATIDETIEFLRRAVEDGPPPDPHRGAPAMPLPRAA